MVAIIVTNHMHEWVCPGKSFNRKEFLKANPSLAIEAENLDLLRELANKSKHFKLTGAKSRDIPTRRQSGFSSGFSFGFARALVVTTRDGRETSIDQVLDQVLTFWKNQRLSLQFDTEPPAKT